MLGSEKTPPADPGGVFYVEEICALYIGDDERSALVGCLAGDFYVGEF